MKINIQVVKGIVSAPGAAELDLVFDLGMPEVETVHIDTDIGRAEVIFIDKASNRNVIVTDLAPFIPALAAFDAVREAKVDTHNAALDAMTYEDVRKLVYPTVEELSVAMWEDGPGNGTGNTAPVEARRVATKNRFRSTNTNATLRQRYKVDTGSDRLDAVPYPDKIATLIGG